MVEYDCTEDVMKHRERVGFWLRDFANACQRLAESHDLSKLQPPEKEIYDQWTPRLQEVEFGSQEYQEALTQMQPALKHHYTVNSHHPEHYSNGIDGMTLYNLIEMFCDWMAASQRKEQPMALEYLSGRFQLSPQLLNIFVNTLRVIDIVLESNNVPTVRFSPNMQ